MQLVRIIKAWTFFCLLIKMLWIHYIFEVGLNMQYMPKVCLLLIIKSKHFVSVPFFLSHTLKQNSIFQNSKFNADGVFFVLFYIFHSKLHQVFILPLEWKMSMESLPPALTNRKVVRLVVQSMMRSQPSKVSRSGLFFFFFCNSATCVSFTSSCHKLSSRLLCSLPVRLLLGLDSDVMKSTARAWVFSRSHGGSCHAMWVRQGEAFHTAFLSECCLFGFFFFFFVRWKGGNMESNCVFMVVICWVNVLSGRECLDCKCEVMVWVGPTQSSGFNADSQGWIIQTVEYFWIMWRGFWISRFEEGTALSFSFLSLLLLSLPALSLSLSLSLSICIVYHEGNIF